MYDIYWLSDSFVWLAKLQFYQFNGKSSGENGRSGAKFTGCYLVNRRMLWLEFGR